MQSSERGKKFYKFFPSNRSDDIFHFLLFLSFFYVVGTINSVELDIGKGKEIKVGMIKISV